MDATLSYDETNSKLMLSKTEFTKFDLSEFYTDGQYHIGDLYRYEFGTRFFKEVYSLIDIFFNDPVNSEFKVPKSLLGCVSLLALKPMNSSANKNLYAGIKKMFDQNPLWYLTLIGSKHFSDILTVLNFYAPESFRTCFIDEVLAEMNYDILVDQFNRIVENALKSNINAENIYRPILMFQNKNNAKTVITANNYPYMTTKNINKIINNTSYGILGKHTSADAFQYDAICRFKYLLNTIAYDSFNQYLPLIENQVFMCHSLLIFQEALNPEWFKLRTGRDLPNSLEMFKQLERKSKILETLDYDNMEKILNKDGDKNVNTKTD